MGKIKVHIFDPVIYPRKVYVAKGKNLECQVKDTFLTPEGDSLNTYGSDTCRAGVWDVQLKEDKKLGVLVWLREKIDISVIAHESVHAANLIFRSCGVEYDTSHDEHFAHLVGWIADCVNQTLTGKFKD